MIVKGKIMKRNNKTKFVIFSAAFLAFFVLILPVFGAMTNTAQSGDWTSYTMPHLTYTTDEEAAGYANYTEGYEASWSGYEAAWNIDINASEPSLFDFFGTLKRFYLVYEVASDNGESIFTQPILIKAAKWYFGSTSIEWLINNNLYYGGSGSGFDLYVTKESTTSISIGFEFWDVESGGSYAYTWQNATVSSDFCDNATINLYLGHDGSGTFDAFNWLSDMMTGTDAPYMPTNTYQPPSEPVRDFLSTLFAVWDVFSGLFSAFINTIVSITPLAPMIFLIYVIDVAFTSFYMGSIQPLGKFFLFIFSVLVSIVTAVADVVNAIIPF